MTIIVLCYECDVGREIAGYAEAFRRRGVALQFFPPGSPPNVNISRLIEQCDERPSLILHPEWGTHLPRGLLQTQIPTMCFQVDTYAFTKRRLRWASLFDRVAVFHPGYDEEFGRRGHQGAFLLPHAVRRELFDREELQRTFDIGWVGQTEGPIYRRRAALLPRLAQTFVMNQWERRYSPEELAETYRRSRIVVNISRDDHPQDANLRVFEAMAAGALLVTSLPTELSELGFVEGVHFVGYQVEQALVPLIQRYLQDEPARLLIAQAGREKILREHTYDCRVGTLLRLIHEGGKECTGLARSQSRARVHLAYLDYFAANGALAEAAAELPQIMSRSVRHAVIGMALLARASVRQLRAKLHRRTGSSGRDLVPVVHAGQSNKSDISALKT